MTDRPLPLDEHLLERARTQWQFGDWPSLRRIEREQIHHHPDRAQLALLAAAGRAQAPEDIAQARQFIRLARDWGCSARQVAQVLVAGVYDTVGRAALVARQESRALGHFMTAVETGVPGADVGLLAQARAAYQAQLVAARLGPAGGHIAFPPQGNAPAASAGAPGANASRESVWTQDELQAQLERCFASDDVLEQIDARLAAPELDARARFEFLCAVSDEFTLRGDTMTAKSFLAGAEAWLPEGDEAAVGTLARKLVALGTSDTALDLLVHRALRRESLGERERAALNASYDKVRRSIGAKAEHGHDLLLSQLQSQWATLKASLGGRRPVLIEIGTTRENVPGQGSTRKLAEFCKANGIRMITVDMDPHNTARAAALFATMGVDFEAVTQKGEDYLRAFAGLIDFAFLDAYDFDHGQHSALRQSRYRKFLGAAIDDAACHAMHLDCAQSLVHKLSPGGLVCVDDTWLVDGRWSAKGTTAMPFLLANGFEVVEARNRAALLRRRASRA